MSKDKADSNIDTRQRVIEAAGEVFAERGYREATIREICQRANANLAAVGYHFGDKAELYGEVLRYAHICAMELKEVQFPADATLEERLELYIRMFVQSILDSGRPAWHGKLMAREMIEPTQALDELVEREIRPKFKVLREIVAGIIGRHPDDEVVLWKSSLVMSQCLFFHQNRAVIARIRPDMTMTPEQVELAIRYITDFSLNGLKGKSAK
jgi:AcrR family transcriptional regulator